MKSFEEMRTWFVRSQNLSAWAYARAMRLRDGGNKRYNMELAALWQGFAAQDSLATRKAMGIE